MSFFDDSRNAGAALLIVGIVQIIAGLVSVIMGAASEEYSLLGSATVGIKQLLFGAVFLDLGRSILNGTIAGKWGIVTRFVLAVATVTIVGGVFSLINADGSITGFSTIDFIFGIIIGLLILWIYRRMTGGRKDGVSGVLWILLLLMFLIGIIHNLLQVLVFPIGTISGICGIIIYAFMTIAILDADIRDRML